MTNFISKTSALFLTAILLTSCASISLPSLQDPSCEEAREFGRAFYSLHFATDLKPTEESLEERSAGLTERFAERVRSERTEDFDPFTLTTEHPRAFKLGACKANEDGSVELEVQMLWRDSDVTKQESVNAIMVKRADKWLIDGVVTRK